MVVFQFFNIKSTVNSTSDRHELSTILYKCMQDVTLGETRSQIRVTRRHLTSYAPPVGPGVPREHPDPAPSSTEIRVTRRHLTSHAPPVGPGVPGGTQTLHPTPPTLTEKTGTEDIKYYSLPRTRERERGRNMKVS